MSTSAPAVVAFPTSVHKPRPAVVVIGSGASQVTYQVAA